jgi:hypothetical protein
MTQADMLWSENGFGLGYIDAASGKLTHHFWCSTKAVGNGPYTIRWMSYQTKKELLELLALLKQLGDQVHSVKLYEPPGIQLQDFLRTAGNSTTGLSQPTVQGTRDHEQVAAREPNVSERLLAGTHHRPSRMP